MKENRELLIYILYTILGVASCVIVSFAIYIISCLTGRITVETKCENVICTVMDKKEDENYIFTGSAYAVTYSYYLFLVIEKEKTIECKIKVESNIYKNITVGDDIECVLYTKYRKNGHVSYDVKIKFSQ